MVHQRSSREIIQWSVGALLLALVLRTWLVMGLIEPVVVAGSSMAPTLRNGERLWIDRTAFQRRRPQRWEVVVARAPRDGTELCVKRIVGLPGEMVEFRDGELWIDGFVVIPPPGLPRTPDQLRDLAPVCLQPGEYFLSGDNGPVSVDSRNWGPVPARLLLGRPLGVR